MRVGKLAMAVGVTACLLGAGPAALAASTPRGGKIRVFVTNTPATKAKILITGAIGDYGTDRIAGRQRQGRPQRRL